MFTKTKETHHLISQQEQEYKGEQLNPLITCGPIPERTFTDIFFTFLYILFWVGTIFIAGFALENGNPQKVLSPFDPDGRQCGFGEAEQYPFMHFNSIVASSLGFNSNYVCVKECVEENSENIQCLTNSQISQCNEIQKYSSQKFFSLCIPTQSFEITYIKQKLNIGNTEQYISDLQTGVPLFIFTAISAFLVSLLFIFLLRIFAGVITWIIILGYFGGLITLGFMCVFNESEEEDQKKKIQLLGIALFVITTVSLIIFICFFSKIRRSIAIMKASADFTRKNFNIFLVPIFMTIIMFMYFSFWIYIMLNIFSSGEITKQQNSPFPSVELNGSIKLYVFYFFFGLFWNIELSIAICQLTIASCASIWYFSHRPNSQTQNSVLQSFVKTITYHLGSVLFGSLIISIVEFIKFIINQIYNDIKKIVSNSENTQNFCIKCCKTCLNVFESYIRFINNNAFVMVALTGENFINSAKNAFYVFYRNQAQIQISQGIGSLFCSIGKYFICLVCTSCCYLIVMHFEYFNERIFSPIFISSICFVISYAFGAIFMNIFGMGSDTLLLCLLSDKELNKGNARACPETLQEFENQYM